MGFFLSSQNKQEWICSRYNNTVKRVSASDMGFARQAIFTFAFQIRFSRNLFLFRNKYQPCRQLGDCWTFRICRRASYNWSLNCELMDTWKWILWLPRPNSVLVLSRNVTLRRVALVKSINWNWSKYYLVVMNLFFFFFCPGCTASTWCCSPGDLWGRSSTCDSTPYTPLPEWLRWPRRAGHTKWRHWHW